MELTNNPMERLSHAVSIREPGDAARHPTLASLLPLAALSLTIGFFEAVFWRGWVLLRLEEAFGLVPTLIRDGLPASSLRSRSRRGADCDVGPCVAGGKTFQESRA
jgi:hypothetical protein